MIAVNGAYRIHGGKTAFAADAQGGVVWQQGRRDEYVVEESDRNLTSAALSVCELRLNRWVSSQQSIDSLTIPSGLCDLTLPTRASPMYGRKTINRNSAGIAELAGDSDRVKLLAVGDMTTYFCSRGSRRRTGLRLR